MQVRFGKNDHLVNAKNWHVHFSRRVDDGRHFDWDEETLSTSSSFLVAN